MPEERVQLNIRIPRELDARLNSLAGWGGKNRFVEDALRHYLKARAKDFEAWERHREEDRAADRARKGLEPLTVAGGTVVDTQALLREVDRRIDQRIAAVCEAVGADPSTVLGGE